MSLLLLSLPVLPNTSASAKLAVKEHLQEPLPLNFSNHLQILELIALLLEEILQTEGDSKEVSDPFKAKTMPTISLKEYLIRLDKFLYGSKESFLMALVLVDRLMTMNEGIKINKGNIHRLFFIATVISIKFLDDKFYKNDYYAKVGGVPLKELNLMEKSFLFMLDFKVNVDEELFNKYKDKLSHYRRK